MSKIPNSVATALSLLLLSSPALSEQPIITHELPDLPSSRASGYGGGGQYNLNKYVSPAPKSYAPGPYSPASYKGAAGPSLPPYHPPAAEYHSTPKPVYSSSTPIYVPTTPSAYKSTAAPAYHSSTTAAYSPTLGPVYQPSPAAYHSTPGPVYQSSTTAAYQPTPSPVVYQSSTTAAYHPTPSPAVYQSTTAAYQPTPSPVVYQSTTAAYQPSLSPTAYHSTTAAPYHSSSTPEPYPVTPVYVPSKPKSYALKHKPYAPKAALPVYPIEPIYEDEVKPAYKSQYQPKPVYDEPEPQPNNYAFGYAVKDAPSGDDYSHSESRDGHKTSGEYRVALPDGRVQIVTYSADENGYQADVRYEGEQIPYDFNSANSNYKHSKPVVVVEEQYRPLPEEPKSLGLPYKPLPLSPPLPAVAALPQAFAAVPLTPFAKSHALPPLLSEEPVYKPKPDPFKARSG